MPSCSITPACIGCNACVEVSPALFARESRRAVIRRQPDTPSLLRDVREAQAACPVGALRISDTIALDAPRPARTFV